MALHRVLPNPDRLESTSHRCAHLEIPAKWPKSTVNLVNMDQGLAHSLCGPSSELEFALRGVLVYDDGADPGGVLVCPLDAVVPFFGDLAGSPYLPDRSVISNDRLCVHPPFRQRDRPAFRLCVTARRLPGWFPINWTNWPSNRPRRPIPRGASRSPENRGPRNRGARGSGCLPPQGSTPLRPGRGLPAQ